MAIVNSQLITIDGLNQVWAATKGLYQKNLDHMNALYTPANESLTGEATGVIAGEIKDLNDRIDGLNLANPGTAGKYISSVSQSAGQLSASETAFAGNIDRTSATRTTDAPTVQAVLSFIASMNFVIKSNSAYSTGDDGQTENATYDANTNTFTLRLPSKVYGAAFN